MVSIYISRCIYSCIYVHPILNRPQGNTWDNIKTKTYIYIYIYTPMPIKQHQRISMFSHAQPLFTIRFLILEKWTTKNEKPPAWVMKLDGYSIETASCWRPPNPKTIPHHRQATASWAHLTLTACFQRLGAKGFVLNEKWHTSVLWSTCFTPHDMRVQ